MKAPRERWTQAGRRFEMTDSSHNSHSETMQGDPTLSAEQVRIVSLLLRDRDSLDPRPEFAECIAEASAGLLQPHQAIAAIAQDTARLDTAELCERVFLATVDLLPTPRTMPRQVVGAHQPVRRSRFTQRAGLLLAASLALAFVVGDILLNPETTQQPPPDGVALVQPIENLLLDVTPIFIPISAGDDDLDDAINDAISIIAFSDLTLEDIESDLAAIERILQH